MHEALELRDKKKAYWGKGVSKAMQSVRAIEQKLIGHDCRDQDGIDRIMINLDSTKHMKSLGANATTAVSIAINKAASSAKECEVHEHVGVIASYPGPYYTPMPFFNVINGGAHAGNALDIQEFMIVPVNAKTFEEAMQIGTECYHSLKEALKKKYGPSAVNIGDEGGFAPPLKKTTEALDMLDKAVKKAGHTKDVMYSLDCAASAWLKGKSYKFEGKAMPGEKLVKFYEKLCSKYPIINIEDPFHEDDFKCHTWLTSVIGNKVQITGDDIFVTDNIRLRDGIRARACNAMLLKINQVGTITQAVEASHLAIHAGYSVMVSHRSGDTSDPFIADFAVGIGATQIKSGAPCRGERLAKYNQLLRLEETGIPFIGDKWRRK